MRFFVRLFLLFAIAGAGSGLLWSQTAGTISGTVTDATGAVIPGAEVVITNEATGERRFVITDDSGFFTAPNVPVGTYTVSAGMPGFRTSVRRDNKVDIRGNIIVNHRLEIGDVADEVTVEGVSAAQVELRSGEVSNLITSEQISELPLTGRSFVQLSLLVPGASIGQTANVRLTGLFAGVDISFSGSASNANMWLVDGTNNVDIGSGRTILTYPSVDSIAEFNISRNMYGADSAASSGAQINVVTKSGTNEFHGTLYHFHRNAALNAADFFLNRANQPKQPLVYNNFGYTIGGPIVKDRAFFFWSQEWRREGRGVPRQALVPTALEAQGDFSGPNSRGYPDPINPFTGEPFPNNRIPAELLSPAGLAWMKLYPLPNIALDSPNFAGRNWVEAVRTPINTRQEQIRGDWIINEQHSFMSRLTLDGWQNSAPSFQEGGLWGDDPFPAVDSDWDQPGKSLTTQWTSTFGPTTVNQVSFSWSGNEIIIERGSGESINAAITAAIPEVFPGPEDRAHATFWGDPLGNDLWHQPPWQNKQDLFVWKDDFSRVVGDHSFRAGFLLSRNSKDEDIDGNGAAYSPQFWTDGGRSIPADWSGVSNAVDTTGNGVADLLLRGTIWGNGTESNTNPRSKVRWRDYEGYFADTWRTTPRLTLNYGVRWSFLPNPFQADDKIGNFISALYDPAEGATPTNGMIFPGNIRGLDVDSRALVKNHFFDIAPRFGFAWDPTGAGRWAIRGGGGVFFNREAISDVLFMSINPPFRTTFNWQEGRALDHLPPEGTANFGGEGVAQRGKEISAKTPGSYQWNLTLERELWRDTKVEFAYVANRGHHIPTQFNVNQVPVEFRTLFAIRQLDGDDSTDPNVLRPFFNLVGGSNGPIVASRSADSWYHSFQTYLVKRFSNNLSYQLSYTFSKLLSTAYGLGHIGGNTISDPFNVEYDKGLAQFDRPHLFNANMIYRTPRLSGHAPFVRGVFGDWETAFIVTMNSGRPETITCCANITGTVSNRPDLIADPEGPKDVDQFFNINAFAPPSHIGQLGKSPRSQYRGPKIANFDVSVMKNFAGMPWFTQEGATLQFRAEFFNALNHTQFRTIVNGMDLSIPSLVDPGGPGFDPVTGQILRYTINEPRFGQVDSIREPREIQFAFKIMW